MAEQPERKTPEQRAQMTDLERLRHSAAHVMATAILRLWPDAQFAYGPPVDDGFYYDVALSHRISPEDFAAIEAEMKKESKANNVFEKIVVTREQAIKDASWLQPDGSEMTEKNWHDPMARALAVVLDDLAGTGELAVATLLSRNIHDHRAGPHALHRRPRNDFWRGPARD